MRTRSDTTSSGTVDLNRIATNYAGYCADPSYGVSVDEPATYVAKSESRWMQDVVTPGFFTKVGKGEIVNSPMTSWKETIEEEPWFHDYARIGYTDELCSGVPTKFWMGHKHVGNRHSSGVLKRGAVVPYWETPPSLGTESLIQLALTSAWANLDLSKAMVLATIGEGQKTTKFLIALFRRLLKIAKNVKSLRLAALARELSQKELVMRYMEARYAIRPLLYDYKNIMEAFNAKTTMLFDRITSRGYESVCDTSESTHSWDNVNDYSSMTTRAKCERTIRVRAGVLAEIEGISTLNRFGVDSLLETGWELLPFSFIADWFFNIGKTIAAWTPEIGLKPLASWYVVEDTTDQVSYLESWTTYGSMGDGWISNYSHWSGCRMTRHHVAKSRFPDPTRSLLPTFKLRIDSLKLIDLAIIVKQLLR